MVNKNSSENSYYKTMLSIAIPIAIQSMLQSALGIVDQIMVGQLGEDAIAAVGLGSRFSFIFIVTLGAIGSTTSIMVAQFWGKNDKCSIARSFMGNALFGLVITLIFFIISIGFSDSVLSVYTKDKNVINLGSEYMRVISIGYIPMLLITLYSSILRSTEKVKPPMIAGILAVVMNTILNYILIFGNLGVPKFGLMGTAYATTITRFLEAFLLILFTYVKKYPGSFRLYELLNFELVLLRKIYIIATPILINEFLWALGENMYSVVYGRMGTDEVAAMTLTYPIQSLSIGLFSGVSAAAGIMVGNKLGGGKNEEAYTYSKKFIFLGIIGAIAFGVILSFCSNIYVIAFNVSKDLKATTIEILIMFSLVLWIKVSNMILGGGILRSGGQTKYTLYLDILGTWGVGVPIGFFAAFVLKLPIHFVYLLISMEELVRLIIGLKLFKTRKWMQNLTENTTAIQ